MLGMHYLLIIVWRMEIAIRMVKYLIESYLVRLEDWVRAGAYARLRRSDNTSGSLMRLSDSNGYCQARIVRIKPEIAI